MPRHLLALKNLILLILGLSIALRLWANVAGAHYPKTQARGSRTPIECGLIQLALSTTGMSRKLASEAVNP
jgi:hypothetical protein